MKLYTKLQHTVMLTQSAITADTDTTDKLIRCIEGNATGLNITTLLDDVTCEILGWEFVMPVNSSYPDKTRELFNALFFTRPKHNQPSIDTLVTHSCELIQVVQLEA